MMQSCNHCFGRLQVEEGHQVWTCHKRNIELVHAKPWPECPYKNSLNCFTRKLYSGTSTRPCREKVKPVMIVLVLFLSFCFLSDHLLCLLASGQEASQVVKAGSRMINIGIIYICVIDISSFTYIGLFSLIIPNTSIDE